MEYVLAQQSNTPSLGEIMKDGVMPQGFSVGGINISPGLVSAVVVTVLLLLAAAIIRIFVIPRFKTVPGKFQAILEKIVEFFSGMATANSPHRNGFLGAFAFSAGVYIFAGTLFELFGWQINVDGTIITLPAVLSDINGCIALAVTAFGVIVVGSVIVNRFRGLGKALIDFSLPISMSFRLYGSLLSGLLVTELIYQVKALYFSVLVPAFAGVIFTLLHAVVQCYILVMLTTMFYGEKTEPLPVKARKPRHAKSKAC